MLRGICSIHIDTRETFHSSMIIKILSFSKLELVIVRKTQTSFLKENFNVKKVNKAFLIRQSFKGIIFNPHHVPLIMHKLEVSCIIISTVLKSMQMVYLSLDYLQFTCYLLCPIVEEGFVDFCHYYPRN